MSAGFINSTKKMEETKVVVFKTKTFEDLDDNDQTNVRCSVGWFSTFCGIFSTIFIVVGSVALGLSSERNQWNSSSCLVNNILSTSNGLSYVNGNNIYTYNTVWNVTYSNVFAKRHINGLLGMYGLNIDDTKALMEIYSLDTTNPCVYRNGDFTLSWTAPFPNTNDIIYTSIAFGIASFLCLVIIVSIHLRYRCCCNFEDC